ncbi:MAG: polysaccharide deacetylase family protein [Rhodospirillales bacterium]|nr:polysaccharide deacetylase family protein [Rhodospirillales bacterium]
MSACGFSSQHHSPANAGSPQAGVFAPQASSTESARGHPAVTFTLDLEYHRDAAACASRVVANTLRILDFLESMQVRGTVFAVGRVARAQPALIRTAAAHGHEVACHSLDHRPIDQADESAFRADTATAKAMLEDIAGVAVVGFRAPVFSMTPRTPWAAGVLRDLGFHYSSSVMPAASPLYGDPMAPPHPFRWISGLVELPCPVARLGPLVFPFLGGIYLRYLPIQGLQALLRRRAGTGLWTYCHPYDVDAEEGLVRFAGAGRVASLLLSLNRRRTFERLRAVLADGAAPPLAERIAAGEFADAPDYVPGRAPDAGAR